MALATRAARAMYWLSDRAADAGDALVRRARRPRDAALSVLGAVFFAAVMLLVAALHAAATVLGDRR